MAASVDGLISGLDTTSLINQLLTLEKGPQTRLQSQRTSVSKKIDLYQALNTRFDAVRTAAEALTAAGAWSPVKTSSTAPEIATATGSTGAAAGSLTLDVGGLARAHGLVSNNTVNPPTAVVATGAVTITTATGVHTLTPAQLGDGSLTAVAAAINAANLGLSAAAVKVGTDAYRLQVTAKGTGADSSFTIDGTNLAALGGFGISDQAADASITVGTGPAAYTVVSPTNTFADLMPGVSVTVRKEGVATIDIVPDNDAVTKKVENLVTAINNVVSYVKAQSTFDATTGIAGPLLSDSMVARLRSSLINATTDPVTGGTYGSAGAAGVSVQKDGMLKFDKDVFTKALATDAAAVQRLFDAGVTGTPDDGVAERLRLVAVDATQSGTGQITTAVEGRKSQLKTLDTQIAAWDERLKLKETALKRQFSALEASLGRLRNQSSWLAGQLGSLPSSSSSQ